MTQDFATSRPPRARKKAGKKSGKKSSSTPAWVWVFTGVVAGAFIMFLVYLAGINPEDMLKNRTQDTTADQGATDSSDSTNKKDKPIFEFYDSLLEDQVVIDDGAEPIQDAQNPVIYTLQAASFKNPKEADAMRAMLLLEGLPVDIVEFDNKGETWHRVLVGPYDTRSKMASARSKLAQHEITPIVLKNK